MNVTILPGPRTGAVQIPSSKSIAHRALICAALAEQSTEIGCRGISADIEATMNCLEGLGAGFEVEGRRILVTPVKDKSGILQDTPLVLPCRESGSTLRFLLPLTGALGRASVFVMEGRLSQRPMQPYETLLQEHGMTIRRTGKELSCKGQLTPGIYSLPGNISSQYFSGLLFSLPLLDGDSRIVIEGALESADYLALTEQMIRRFGIRLEKAPDGYRIFGGQRYLIPENPQEISVEGDYSSAAFFLCAGAFSKEGIRAGNLSPHSAQGDRRILEVLQRFGAVVLVEQDTVFVKKGALTGIDIDASMIPDLIPVLCVVAAAAEGTTRVYHAQRLRMKESDRIESTCSMLKSLGAEITETPDGMIIQGTGQLEGGAVIDPCQDHRIAMSSAVAAGICRKEVVIQNAECAAKSYPDFWRDLQSLNLTDQS
ncbi:MAG: 3-phosphoshikimate 1-carboxyvinyltransferase [Parasporobacterium sp.]|nr:3-phosphoshikimate 1-carboxyvinyltransferase [Parasporobacterium sp.]